MPGEGETDARMREEEREGEGRIAWAATGQDDQEEGEIRGLVVSGGSVMASVKAIRKQRKIKAEKSTAGLKRRQKKGHRQEKYRGENNSTGKIVKQKPRLIE